MLFDFDYGTKVSIKIELPNIILLFIENLCYCSLKIAVCVPKITIISKNCRLKITDISKNYRLKIAVRVCIYARMYARAYDSGQIVIRTHDHHRNTTGIQDTTGKGRNTK